MNLTIPVALGHFPLPCHEEGHESPTTETEVEQ
jgi:hypothetical protein